MRPKPINPKPKLPSMMEYNGPRRKGPSPLDQALNVFLDPLTALSGIVNKNAPIKKGGKYRVPQSMMQATPKRKNSVTAHPKARANKNTTVTEYAKLAPLASYRSQTKPSTRRGGK
jgi:hypothetical protein